MSCKLFKSEFYKDPVPQPMSAQLSNASKKHHNTFKTSLFWVLFDSFSPWENRETESDNKVASCDVLLPLKSLFNFCPFHGTVSAVNLF